MPARPPNQEVFLSRTRNDVFAFESPSTATIAVKNDTTELLVPNLKPTPMVQQDITRAFDPRPPDEPSNRPPLTPLIVPLGILLAWIALL